MVEHQQSMYLPANAQVGPSHQKLPGLALSADMPLLGIPGVPLAMEDVLEETAPMPVLHAVATGAPSERRAQSESGLL